MSDYLTVAQLADKLGVDAESILRWRREYSWPSLKIGRKISFSPEHVAQILAQHEAKPEAPKPVEVAIAGQTERSRQRSA